MYVDIDRHNHPNNNLDKNTKKFLAQKKIEKLHGEQVHIFAEHKSPVLARQGAVKHCSLYCD
jgi:hypothetical protein